MQEPSTVMHPGLFVKKNVLPAGMTVTEAAKLLGVGRPALSNFLNGNAALSHEMAIRLEKAFNANKHELMNLQQQYEVQFNEEREGNLTVSTYVPTFLAIKAAQIESWADKLDSRARLAVLLRKLINSTVSNITHIDFPAYDNSQRHGWDGTLECSLSIPWVPSGKSGWEFGCTAKPGQKADKDYTARTSSVTPTDRAETTFVFVTPHDWPGKAAWQKEKSKLGDWKSVEVFDASDLEQWLEQSIPAQIWLAEELGLPVTGFATLEHHWRIWAEATEPNMTRSIFDPYITAHKDTFADWLKKPSRSPLVISAESTQEALAFVSIMFQDDRIKSLPESSTAAVFTSIDTLRNLCNSNASFIPIVYTNDAEKELIKTCKQRHCIVIHRHGTMQVEPNIALQRLSSDEFESALGSMGFDRDHIGRLARESGRSLTVLRRRLSSIQSVKTPSWANDSAIVSALIPFSLVGTWKEDSESDREIIRCLADGGYGEIETGLAKLLTIEDSPVWSIGSTRALVSKVDSLFTISSYLTAKHIKDFLVIAEFVLSELDPALELPEDQRWAAGIYGKIRGHSGTLRKAICETLILLAVHGNDLFQERLGIDVENEVSLLVSKLLSPISTKKLKSHDRDLPYYAEAAPHVFLKLVEDDLNQSDSAVMTLMTPVDSGVFAHCWRSSMLWALECLAWKPGNLPRVTLILARMSERELEDNWVNKPINSLKAIYCWWMPQTAASFDQRIAGLNLLLKRFPAIAWKICMEQVGSNRLGHNSYKPLWRSEAAGAGNPNCSGDNYKFRYEALRIAINWSDHDEMTLGDLVAYVHKIPETEQRIFWDTVDKWAQSAEEKAKASLREKIRRCTFTRRGRKTTSSRVSRDRAHAAFAMLSPRIPSLKHAWLFEQDWIEPSYDEVDDDSFNYEARLQKVDRERRDAMKEIWSKERLDGVLSLITGVESAYLVGRYLACSLNEQSEIIELLLESLINNKLSCERKRDAFMAGLMRQFDGKIRQQLICHATERKLSETSIVKILTLAPFDKDTWKIVYNQSSSIQNLYWKTVRPNWGRYDESELTQIIDRLLEVDRPRVAFVVCSMDWDKVDGESLKKLLRAVVKCPEGGDDYKLESYVISAAFKSLNSRADSTEEDMANLEFQFITPLEDTDYGTPNLERVISKSPKLFADIVALTTKRKDSGEDPAELVISDDQRKQSVATACYTVLSHIKHLPGLDPDTGEINSKELNDWLTQTRALLAELGRQSIGDQYIGQLLARHSAKSDGIWPCEAICDALERLGSEHIASGFRIQIFNSRGVHWSAGDGKEERELSQRYRSWAQNLAFEYPFVARILDEVARGYERDAFREVSEGKLRTKLLD